MKKKKRLLLVLCLALFVFSYYKVNRGKSNDLIVKKYEFGQQITYGNLEFSIDKGEIFTHVDQTDKIPIIYRIKNKSKDEIDVSKLILEITYRNGLSNDEICQNFAQPNFPLNPSELSYKKLYHVEYFILEPKEEKTFELYYNIDKVYYQKYPSCLKFPNSFYWDKFTGAMEDKALYYEILEWNAK